MIKLPPSILNDVIGPIMRGPSSSHTAASVRIGRLVGQFFASEIISFHVDFEPKGSLAATYRSQGSDIGLVGGILGMETYDPGLLKALEIAAAKGVEVTFQVSEYPANHPNTYKIQAADKMGERVCFLFVSTGGGMIELREVNKIPVTIAGDFYETLLFFNESDPETLDKLASKAKMIASNYDYCSFASSDQSGLIQLKSNKAFPSSLLDLLKELPGIVKVINLEPVLPIRSIKDCKVPFQNASEVIQLAENEQKHLWELALRYESERGDILPEEVCEMFEEILKTMKNSISEGLKGNIYSDRILGPQAVEIFNTKDKLIGGNLIKTVIAYVTAIMETKSSMGVIVAAPTAGSCGGLPGTLLAVAEELGLGDDEIIKALLTAGLVGILIAKSSTFAAEECGCQAECGSGSGMAAAALVQMAGGSAKQSLAAASMALQNIMGSVCDPVANRVEVPCLGKNILAAMNAIASANMALAGFDPVIPLDEAIASFDQVGRMIPAALRCTGKAGLSVTPTSKRIKAKLEIGTDLDQ